MLRVNVFEVKAKLSEYIDRALRGERIVICRHNKPVAELRALETLRTEARPVGPLPGRPVFDVLDSFFEPLTDDDLDRWEGVHSDSARRGKPDHAGRGKNKVAEAQASYPSRTSRRSSKRRS